MPLKVASFFSSANHDDMQGTYLHKHVDTSHASSSSLGKAASTLPSKQETFATCSQKMHAMHWSLKESLISNTFLSFFALQHLSDPRTEARSKCPLEKGPVKDILFFSLKLQTSSPTC